MSPSSALDEDDTPLPPPRRTAASTAWVLVFFDGMLLGCGSLYWLVRGRFFDEALYYALAGSPATQLSAPAENIATLAIRLGGVLGLSASLLVMAVALGAYRGGERWAWYATWALPLYCSLEMATLASYQALTPTVVLWDVGLFSLALAALVAGYRHFFAAPEERPRSEPRSAPA